MNETFPRYHFDAVSKETAKEAKDYPYGGLKTSMFFWIEDGGKKGWRNVMQSVNPKSGRLNAPKKSTYSHTPLFITETKEGFYEFTSCPDLRDKDGKNVNDFIAKFWEILPEQYKSYLKICWKMAIIRSPDYYKDTVINVELPKTKKEKELTGEN